jgi:hypothetical protein
MFAQAKPTRSVAPFLRRSLLRGYGDHAPSLALDPLRTAGDQTAPIRKALFAAPDANSLLPVG